MHARIDHSRKHDVVVPDDGDEEEKGESGRQGGVKLPAPARKCQAEARRSLRGGLRGADRGHLSCNPHSTTSVISSRRRFGRTFTPDTSGLITRGGAFMFRLSVIGMLAAMLVTGIALPAAAQSQAVNGSIEGTIRDSSGAALPGVTITVTNTDTGAQRVV